MGAIQSSINASLGVAAGAIALGKKSIKEAEAEKKAKAESSVKSKMEIADIKGGIAQNKIDIDQIDEKIGVTTRSMERSTDGVEMEIMKKSIKRMKEVKSAKLAQNRAFRERMNLLKEGISNG